MKATSSNISLIVGLAIPVVMILAIAAAVLLPGRSLNPTTDFVYAIGSYPFYITRSGDTVTQHDLSIRDAKLTESTQTSQAAGYPSDAFVREAAPRFFLHNTKEDTNKELSLEEVKNLSLSGERKSPDGFTVSFGRRSYGVFPFFFDSGSDMEHAYLSNQTASKEISIVTDNAQDMYQFQLVGWVLEK